MSCQEEKIVMETSETSHLGNKDRYCYTVACNKMPKDVFNLISFPLSDLNFVNRCHDWIFK